MKKFSKILSVALLVALVLSFGAMAYAADEPDTTPVTATTGTITIDNAAKGETYSIVKIFDATISTAATDGQSNSIAYTFTGDLPNTLATVFEKIEGTDYVQKKANASDEAIISAVQTYAATLTATEANTKVATGGPVVFNNVPFGYYAVKSSQGTVISVDSTNPDVVIYDKNTTTVSGGKEVEKVTYSIGDTVKYTATFNTTNWLGEGANAKQVTKYVVFDTLPAFLSGVKITSVRIISTPDDPTTENDETDVAADLSSNYSQFAEMEIEGYPYKGIEIEWATVTGEKGEEVVTSKYPNGALIEIKYEGTLTSVTNINAGDINTVIIKPFVWDNEEKPWEQDWKYDKEIKTYAAALKKVDENEKALAGAKFAFYGLNVEKTADGVYTVVSYDPSKYNTEQGATQVATNLGTEMEVGADGKLYVVGLASDVTLHGVETKAPNGYNQLAGEVELAPQILGKQVFKSSGYEKYDAKGNLIEHVETEKEEYTEVVKNLSDLDTAAVKVVNNKGTELPSTGGIGTTIFYVVGGVLVLAAIILLVTKKRMSE